MSTKRNGPSITPEHAELRDEVFRDLIPPGAFDQAIAGSLAIGEFETIAAGDDRRAELAADIIKVYAADGIKSPMKKWWNGEYGAQARVHVVVPFVASGPAGESPDLTIRARDFQPLRAVPEVDELGTRTGFQQTTYLLDCPRETALAIIDQILATVADWRVKGEVAVAYRRQLEKHPDARTVRSAFERDGIDPMELTVSVA